jgi:hypothetical protein
MPLDRQLDRERMRKLLGRKSPSGVLYSQSNYNDTITTNDSKDKAICDRKNIRKQPANAWDKSIGRMGSTFIDKVTAKEKALPDYLCNFMRPPTTISNKGSHRDSYEKHPILNVISKVAEKTLRPGTAPVSRVRSSALSEVDEEEEEEEGGSYNEDDIDLRTRSRKLTMYPSSPQLPQVNDDEYGKQLKRNMSRAFKTQPRKDLFTGLPIQSSGGNSHNREKGSKSYRDIKSADDMQVSTKVFQYLSRTNSSALSKVSLKPDYIEGIENMKEDHHVMDERKYMPQRRIVQLGFL